MLEIKTGFFGLLARYVLEIQGHLKLFAITLKGRRDLF